MVREYSFLVELAPWERNTKSDDDFNCRYCLRRYLQKTRTKTLQQTLLNRNTPPAHNGLRSF